MEIEDVVYGTFTIPSDVAAIVSTPQFQRLKSIKQLGFLLIDNEIEHEHHRYAHCLGTYHAASLMLDALEKNTKWLRDNNNKIPAVYRKAVQIAALLHDVAHGPFSHAWEHVVKNYQHETEAFPCIDNIFKQINEKLFPELRHNNNYGIKLIKALIDGHMEKFTEDLPLQYCFIFEIVSNKKAKLDVDKWDYLKRDFHYLKHLSKPNMDFDDVFLKARVSDSGLQIEYRYEDFDKIYNLFKARYLFHVQSYSLPQYLLRDYILNAAIIELKPKINNIPVTDISAHNMSEFLELTDENVLKLIKSSDLYPYLQYEAKYVKINDLPHKTFSAPVDIKAVDKYMPSKENINFYGDIINQPFVEDQTCNVKKVYHCYCDHDKHVVYYSIDYQ